MLMGNWIYPTYCNYYV